MMRSYVTGRYGAMLSATLFILGLKFLLIDVLVERGEYVGGIAIDDGLLPSTTNLTVNDVTFTIRTSHSLAERWDAILRTWHQHASVVWVTDKRGGNVTSQQWVETSCVVDHSLAALSCKTEAEFEEFMRRKTKWWCHVDDDMYVNTDVLSRLLSKYNSSSDVYLGRNSITHPANHTAWGGKPVRAWFGTGGVFCISRALALKMDRYVSRGRMVEMSLKLGSPDDVTLGFIINFLLGTRLTATDLIRTHIGMHGLKDLTPDQIPLQAMLSYGKGDVRVNITANDVRGKSKFFNTDEDPSRFFTIHCMIRPQTDYCQET